VDAILIFALGSIFGGSFAVIITTLINKGGDNK